ncbi:hypothetical protein DdX_12741 [Ditylenchus destructor]|uniref:Uncharacterized protein n=1 Tax=Ditylenchus destructor TaxID=166010 RepID=A0AAD4MWL4_9BILA|nr:hypothetical protein DdX_12741 [Ditylenchus destructor]
MSEPKLQQFQRETGEFSKQRARQKLTDKRLAAWVRDNRSHAMMVDQAQKMFQPVFGPEIDMTFNASNDGWCDSQSKFEQITHYLLILVIVVSTGHEKSRITVMLTATSDGKKCLPYVLLPLVDQQVPLDPDRRKDVQQPLTRHGFVPLSHQRARKQHSGNWDCTRPSCPVVAPISYSGNTITGCWPLIASGWSKIILVASRTIQMVPRSEIVSLDLLVAYTP